jgi:hypothetical protein
MNGEFVEKDVRGIPSRRVWVGRKSRDPRAARQRHFKSLVDVRLAFKVVLAFAKHHPVCLGVTLHALVHRFSRLALPARQDHPTLRSSLRKSGIAIIDDLKRRCECFASLTSEHPDLEARAIEEPTFLVREEGDCGRHFTGSSKIP